MVKITEHKKGLKMEGFLSLNTAPSINPFCEQMSKDKACICAQCYGKYMERRYPRAKHAWAENFKALTTAVLTDDQAANIADVFNRKRRLVGVRLHSVGEIYNDFHIENFRKIVSNIKVDIPVTIWTKRLSFIKGLKERLQCNIIYSNPRINTAIEPSHFADIPVLHTFNVYDDKVQQNADMARLKASGINTVECTGSCKDCMVCYPKYGTDAAHYAIFELTEKAQGKTRS